MQVTTIANISLSDFMLRLDQREKQVVALASSSENGWSTVLGWDPDAFFMPATDDEQSVTEQLDVFAQNQQGLGRLVVGYMSYDLGVALHGVKSQTSDDLNTPLVYAVGFSSWLCFNSKQLTIHSSDESYTNAVKQIIKRPPRDLPTTLYDKGFTPSESREQYRAKYQKVKGYITAGDVYQVNLTHRLEGETSLQGRDLFCILDANSQSDFRAYIEGDDFEVLSFSPERFIKITGDTIETNPIKGTRPRGDTHVDDERLCNELKNSSKDQAELNMITDLMRNDIGGLSKVGTVSVAQKRTLTAYPTLWHAHSTVKGQLIKGISPISALASMMPGGSITGCPKKRAIEIIDELEGVSRGVYTGSIFVLNTDGSLDSNIAIRTVIKKGRKLYLSVGGGIVHDSVEEDEYQESLDKAASFMQASRPAQLSSDVLEQQFGATKIDILYQNDRTRVIQTVAEEGGQVLEVSMVEFVQAGVNEFPKVHKEIQQGKSMGKAFREHGLGFTRNVQSTNASVLQDELSIRFGSDGPATIVEVAVTVGPNNTPYANILETYSPKVSWPMKHYGTPLPEDKIKQLGELLAYNKE